MLIPQRNWKYSTKYKHNKTQHIRITKYVLYVNAPFFIFSYYSTKFSVVLLSEWNFTANHSSACVPKIDTMWPIACVFSFSIIHFFYASMLLCSYIHKCFHHYTKWNEWREWRIWSIMKPLDFWYISHYVSSESALRRWNVTTGIQKQHRCYFDSIEINLWIYT